MAGTKPFVQLDSEGREIPDDTPIVIYVNNRPITDFDRIRELIAVQLSHQAAAGGRETMEEANDFDVDDELFPVSPHEYAEETEAADREALAAEAERRKKAKTPAPPAPQDKRRRKADLEDVEDGVQPVRPPPEEPDGSDH